jgi:hypothetical protein
MNWDKSFSYEEVRLPMTRPCRGRSHWSGKVLVAVPGHRDDSMPDRPCLWAQKPQEVPFTGSYVSPSDFSSIPWLHGPWVPCSFSPLVSQLSWPEPWFSARSWAGHLVAPHLFWGKPEHVVKPHCVRTALSKRGRSHICSCQGSTVCRHQSSPCNLWVHCHPDLAVQPWARY